MPNHLERYCEKSTNVVSFIGYRLSLQRPRVQNDCVSCYPLRTSISGHQRPDALWGCTCCCLFCKNIRAVSSAVWADKGPVWRPRTNGPQGMGAQCPFVCPLRPLRCHTVLSGTHSHPYPLFHISILKCDSSAFDRTQLVSSRFVPILLTRGLAATLWLVAVGQRYQLAGWQEAVRLGVWVTADSGFGVAPCGAVRITAACVGLSPDWQCVWIMCALAVMIWHLIARCWVMSARLIPGPR